MMTAFNLIGPLMFVVMIGSVIGISVGIVRKNKKILLASTIVLMATVAINIIVETIIE